MSDPKNPGGTPSGAEPDSTIIRSAKDFYGERGAAPEGDRGAARPPARAQQPGSSGAGADASRAQDRTKSQPAMPTSRSGGSSTPDRTGSAASAASASSAGRQQFRPPEARDTERQPARDQQTDRANAPAANSQDRKASFGDRLKARAKTVSAGMSGASAAAVGGAAANRSAGPREGSRGDSGPLVATSTDDDGQRQGGALSRSTRKARLRLAQVDPWSVMKTAFLFSVAAGIVLWVATGTIWAVISSSGMFEEINRMVGDIVQTPGDDTPFRIQDYISTSKVMGTAALIAVIDVVILTALATLGAFLYNLASAMIGGLEVTLAED